jgi:hypothetical protein
MASQVVAKSLEKRDGHHVVYPNICNVIAYVAPVLGGEGQRSQHQDPISTSTTTTTTPTTWQEGRQQQLHQQQQWWCV